MTAIPKPIHFDPIVGDPAEWIARIDVSSLNQYAACPRRFLFESRLGLDDPSHAHDRIFGTACHAGFETLLQTRNPDSAISTMESVYRSWFPPETDPDFAPKIPSIFDRSLRQFLTKYGLPNIEVLAIERPAALPLPNGDYLWTRRDLVARRPSTNQVVVYDYKTSRYCDSRWWQDQWHLSSQIHAYQYITQLQYPRTDVSVILVAFHFTKPPRLKKDGTAYANDTDCKQEMLEYRRPPWSVHAWLDWTMTLLDRLRADDARLLSGDLLDDIGRLTAYPQDFSGHACARFNRPCPFLDICAQCPNPLATLDYGRLVPAHCSRRYWDPTRGPLVTASPQPESTAPPQPEADESTKT